MTKTEDYKKWLGTGFMKSVSEVEFQVTPLEKVNERGGITHVAHESVPIFEINCADHERDRRIDYCQRFFGEVADKLEVMAMQLVPNVVIPEDFSKRVLITTRDYLNRVYRGEEKYRQHLCTDTNIVMQDKKKMVIVKLAVGIHNAYAKPQLFWMVLSEAMAEKCNDTDTFTRVCEIEKNYFE